MHTYILLLCAALFNSPARGQIVFSDVARAVGVDDGGTANGAVFGDVNGDGWPDLFVARLELDAGSLLYVNRGDGTFVDERAAVAPVGRAMGGVFVDYDGDGDEDLYAVRFNEPNALLRNDLGRLSLLPEDALAPGYPGATSAAFADFDGNGSLDLFSTHRYGSGNQYFTDLTAEPPIDVSFNQSALRAGQETFAAVPFDIDGDGDQDLYVANFGYVDLLHVNDGRGVFNQAAGRAGLRENGFSVAGLPADYDGDGDFDLYVLRANEQENALWENDGGGRFELHRVGAEGRNSSAGGVAADFDLDGDVDLLISNLGGVDVYANRGDGYFDVISSTALPSRMQKVALTAGAAAADIDRDGDIDVFLSGVRGVDALLRNEVSVGHWLSLNLPSSSVGARVEVLSEGVRQVRHSAAYTQLGSGSMGEVHVGLPSENPVNVRVYWPSGNQQLLQRVATDRMLLISPLLPTNDLAIMAINEPRHVPSSGPLNPSVDIANVGEQSIVGQTLQLQVFSEGVLLYDERSALPLIRSGERIEYSLPAFIPQRGGLYEFVFQLLVEDNLIANNRWVRKIHWFPFTEMAAELGIDDAGAGWSAAMADSDGDGDIDLYVSNGGSYGVGDNVFYRNDGVRFSDVTQVNGTADSGNGTGVVFADFNGDGHQDMYMSKGGFLPPGEPDRLLYNSGDGTFVDASEEVGIDEVQASYATAVGDYDADGQLDLYVSKFRGQYNALFHNVAGQFKDERRRRRVISYQRFTGSAAAFSDFDLDGDIDLYASMYGTYDLFYAETGDSSYVATQVGDEGDAVGIAMGDYDADGDFDIYVVNQTWRSVLWRNDLDTKKFVDVASQSGVENQGSGTGCAFGDYDNDGDLDLFVVNARGANRVYMNRGDGTFKDVAFALGMVDSVRTRAVLLSDYDNDGDLDPYVVNERYSNRLYRNDGDSSDWLQVRLRGSESNRNAVGARVTLYAGSRTIHRQVNGTAGMALSSRLVHFGLGREGRVDSLVLHWPNRRVQRATSLPINRRIEFVEGLRPTAVREDNALPEDMQLLPNYPNPFNSETRIAFTLPEPTRVRIVVYNVLGQSVRTLLSSDMEAGRHELTWDGRNDQEINIASGVYFYRLYAKDHVRSRSLVLLR